VQLLEKNVAGTNTLAYFVLPSVAKDPSFIASTPGYGGRFWKWRQLHLQLKMKKKKLILVYIQSNL
jgi:hypothetical protein